VSSSSPPPELRTSWLDSIGAQLGGSPLHWAPVDKATAFLVGSVPFVAGYVIRISYLLTHPEEEPYIARSSLAVVMGILVLTLLAAVVALVVWRSIRRRDPAHPVYTRGVLGVWFATIGLTTYFVGPFTSPILAALLGGAMAVLVFFEIDVARFAITIGLGIVVMTGVAERLGLIPYGPLFAHVFGGEFRPTHAFVLVNAFFVSALFAAVLSLFAVVMRMWRKSDAEVHLLAITDPLTSLSNRRNFMERLELELSRSRRYDDRLALVLMDVDHFKDVNDAYGHVTGDRVLVAIARDGLVPALRAVDLAGRFGGEEFAVILPATDLDGAMVVAERLRARVAEIEVDGPGSRRITASFGVAAVPEVGADDVVGLIRAADEALYRAKAEGRDRVVAAPRASRREPAVGA
jgi:diguanylate cyclase (GGDEF)-like protein